MQQQIREIPVASIKDNPRNKEVHGDFEPKGRDAWLIESVKSHGVQLPVLVQPDGTLHDGHRRKYAAIAAGRKTLPGIVTESDDAATFMNAQLGRNLSLYAKCVLYRKLIESLVSRGKQSRQANRPRLPEGVTADPSVDRDWTQAEEVLGVTRQSLSRGVALLGKIRELRSHSDVSAEKIESVFRNRGLRPALRLLGYDPPSSSIADEDANDCADWQDDTEGMLPIKRKKREKKPKKPKPTPVPVNADGEADTEAWRQEALDHLDAYEEIITERELFAKQAEEHLQGLRAIIVEYAE